MVSAWEQADIAMCKVKIVTDPKRKLLTNLIIDLGKIWIGAGAIEQVLSETPNWLKIFIVSIGSVILFMVAFFIYPNSED